MQEDVKKTVRRSPVVFSDESKTVDFVNGFEVVREYKGEVQDNGTALIDLSHLSKWDIQGSDLRQVAVHGQEIPPVPGECRIIDDRLLFRMNPTQAGIWHICDTDAPPLPDDPAVTDITDAWALFGLAGESLPDVLEQITEIDLLPPGGSPLMLIQGPIFHVPARIVIIKQNPHAMIAMIAFPRGFGQSAAEAFCDVGSRIGIHVAGVNIFYHALSRILA